MTHRARAKGVTRRDFMKGAAGAAVAAATVQAEVYKSILPQAVLGANETIHTGHIGLGGMGSANLKFALNRKDIRPIALCDLYPVHLERAAEMAKGKFDSGITLHHDFREIIENKDVDAVVVSTPDHWHAIPSIMACDARKDVWCEKPLSTTIEEGRHMVDAARRNNVVFQCGTMQRSGEHFQEAVKLVQDGYIGKVSRVATWIHDGYGPEGMGNPPDEAPPEGCDWEFHQGWTHRVPFNRNRWLFTFRWFLDYSGGMLTDWGAHLIDIAIWAMGEDIQPLSAHAVGGKYIIHDNRTAPDTLEVVWQFPEYVLTFSNRMYNIVPHGVYNDRKDAGHGIVFYGSLGTLHLDRSGYEVFSMRRGEKFECAPRTWVKMGQGSPMHNPHWADFAEAVKSRKKPISDVQTAYNTVRVCHMGTCSYVAGGQVFWDPQTERFTGGDAEITRKANEWAYRPYENGWTLG